MIEILKRLLSPEYLVVAEPGPLGSLWLLYATLGLAFAAGLGAAAWALAGPRRTQRSAALRAWAWYELWICLAGLLAIVGRFGGWPGWSARIWPYSLLALAMVGAGAYRLRRLEPPPWLRKQLGILTFTRPCDGTRAGQPLAWPWLLLGLGLHLAGVGLVVTGRFHWPWWTPPLVLAVLLLPQLPGLLGRRRLNRPGLMALTPLLGAYAATALWLLYRELDITIIAWQGLAFPDPLTSLFYVDGLVLAAAAYALLCQIYLGLDRPERLWRPAVAGLLAVTLAWAGIVYLGKRTHGATASDPFAYAQMGVDLAENGTFLHRYALFERVIPLDIAWAPLQPVGYHIPRNSQGDCPSVWATGASVLLAAGYKLLGEVGLYVTTPIVALLSLWATWLLVQEALRDESRGVRYLTAALAVALLATSPEHVDRLLVPMADAAAQLFTTLTLLFALRAHRRLAGGDWRSGNWALVLAGVFFAWAYWVRHTQLVLALPVLLALWSAKRDRKISNSQALVAILLFFGAALVAALPDIAYRWRVFGGPLATETTELPAMGLQHIGPMFLQTLGEGLVAGEWGYLFPLALYGAYGLARQHRRAILVLGSAFGAVLLVHLTYRFLRLRDLLSIFPLLDLAVAYGAVMLVRGLRHRARQSRRLGPALLAAGAVAWIVLGLGLARWAMIDNAWRPGWASFGYMRAEHRAAFDRLVELTPPEAVIGASLNAGAIGLYTTRAPIRPYDSWTDEEWAIFLGAMEADDRPVYLLDDGGLMADFIARERGRRRLMPIAELQIPLFYTQDRETGWLYRLEWQ